MKAPDGFEVSVRTFLADNDLGKNSWVASAFYLTTDFVFISEILFEVF